MKKLLLLYASLHSFFAFSQQRYDVIITEIMADPNPAHGLPNYEWIELKNHSPLPINLQHWRIGNANSQSGPFPPFLLQPGAFVIICSNTALPAMLAFGQAIGTTSFPSLGNETDRLFIRTADGITMHGVEYRSSWYRNTLKQQGGWTLEMIDPNTPCAGANNWIASTDISGGTPGRINASNAITTDVIAPRLKRSYATDSTTIILVFDEPLDSLSGATLSHYTIDPGIIVTNAMTIAPLFNEVQLKLASPLVKDIVYTVSATGIQDCRRNTGNSSTHTGRSDDPLPGEWIINEVLFNPPPGGNDYVECYNHSNKIIDASRLYIATRNSSGVLNGITPLHTRPFLVFPGDHIAVTENAEWLALQYLVSHPAQVLEIPAFPSLPDSKGIIVLLNSQGTITDQLTYSDDWHFPLIANPEGVSLERIDPSGTTQDRSNWHSAASTAGYGTPGYKNSQYKQMGMPAGSVEVKPTLFSPDNDGIDDIASIHYRLDEPGYTANITIFDAAGRPVRYLVRNDVLGTTGYWNWDGLNETGGRLPAGIYIILSDLFTIKGKRIRFKETIVLAYKVR